MTAVLLSLVMMAALEPGVYKGKWQGDNGDSGDLNITLAKADKGFTATVSFTTGGEEVKAQVTSVKVVDSKLTIVMTFEMGDSKSEATLEGEAKGSTIEGKYVSRIVPSGEVGSQGTWSVSAAK